MWLRYGAQLAQLGPILHLHRGFYLGPMWAIWVLSIWEPYGWYLGPNSKSVLPPHLGNVGSFWVLIGPYSNLQAPKTNNANIAKQKC